jgi:hypothetical protein
VTEIPVVSEILAEADGGIATGDSFSGNERRGRHPEEVVGLEKLTGSEDLATRETRSGQRGSPAHE